MNSTASAVARALSATLAAPIPISRDYLSATNAGQFRRSPTYTIKSTQSYSVAVTPIATSVFPLSDAYLSSSGHI